MAILIVSGLSRVNTISQGHGVPLVKGYKASGLLPGPVTMDVDFGVTLVAEAGGQYGSMADDLSGQGFKLDEKGRYVRQFETMPVFIDFLTEHHRRRG